jgi:hypothetical protein
MNFKLDVVWDSRFQIILWSFLPQDRSAEALLERLGFHDVFKHSGALTLHGLAAVAVGRMLRACGATFGDQMQESE